MRSFFLFLLTFSLCKVAWGQTPATSSAGRQPGNSSTGMSHEMPGMKDMPMSGTQEDNDAGSHVMNSMEGRMDMGPHMKMTALRAPKSGDAARAQQVAEQARKASEKYKDYHAALADGFKIFHPEIPQKIYHFTSYANAIEAQFKFDPYHPTSLLYEKHGESYGLIGVMYTAPKRFSEDQLDERIPLSVAQWHEHVNFCAAPADRKGEYLAPHPKFGLRGSIVTQEECDAAGGKFHPVIFNWMVHLYPFEKDQANIWSVERQHSDAN
jgi:hypothetical protein